MTACGTSDDIARNFYSTERIFWTNNRQKRTMRTGMRVFTEASAGPARCRDYKPGTAQMTGGVPHVAPTVPGKVLAE